MFKNRIIKVFTIVLALLTLTATCFSFGCKEKPDTDKKPPETYVLSAMRKTLSLDEEYQLSVIGETDGKTVVWDSKDVTVATVTNGLVKGVGVGETVITARIDDQVLECEIKVEIVLETYLEITLPLEVDNQIQLTVGDEYTFQPELTGEANQTVTFTLTCGSEALAVDGLTITANSVATDVEVTISCNVQGVEPLTVLVSVA